MSAAGTVCLKTSDHVRQFRYSVPAQATVPPALTATTSPDYGGTLSILCATAGGQALQSIEVGKGPGPANLFVSSIALATIGINSQIV